MLFMAGQTTVPTAIKFTVKKKPGHGFKLKNFYFLKNLINTLINLINGQSSPRNVQ